MTRVIVHGFQRSTFVNMVRLVLTHKGVAFEFNDLEAEMGTPAHLALHPFNRVPILEHDGFRLYETSAIMTYVDEAFDGPRLQPDSPRERGRMMQWISAVGSYYYYWIVYHLGHERSVFPELDIQSDEKVVAAALPNVANALDVLERELGHGQGFLISAEPTLADFAMLPMMTSLGFQGRTGHARDQAAHPAVAGKHGGAAERRTLPSIAAASRADLACPSVGRVASSEILKHRRTKFEAGLRGAVSATRGFARGPKVILATLTSFKS